MVVRALQQVATSAVLPALLLLSAADAQAQAVQVPQHASAQHRDENGEMLKRDPAPVTWTLTYNSDINADVSGGAQRGAAYLQRVGLIADADLDRLVGWHGATAHLSVHAIEGNGLSGLRVGNILTVSGIEAEPALRLFNLWVEQKLGDRVTIRAGQFTAAQEFAVSSTASLFVNSTFGWPASFATDLPSGGPAYPLAAPGLRAAVKASDTVNFRVAVFSGDPAGQGGGDPQRRDVHGLNGFRLKGRPFVIGEVTRSARGDDPAWSVTLGGWVHLGRFDDLLVDRDGRSLASPLSSGQPLRHRGDGAVYAMTDWRLWRLGARSVHAFLRASGSPADRNAVDLYLDGGVSMTSPFRGRPNDIAGIAFGIARISPDLRALVRDRLDTAGEQRHVPGFEGVIEASYQLKINRALSVQPNAQLILHPSGALLSGDIPDRFPRHAIVLGIRNAFRF